MALAVAAVVAQRATCKHASIASLYTDLIQQALKATATVTMEADTLFYEKLRQADFIDEDNLARFFSRSNTGNFQVFRIEEKPESYEDFAIL